MTKEFFLLHIVPKKGITREQIEEKLNLAVDWYRYSLGNYVLYTSSDKDKWYQRLEKFVIPDGALLICKLDTGERQGWIEEFWTWLETNIAKMDIDPLS